MSGTTAVDTTGPDSDPTVDPDPSGSTGGSSTGEDTVGLGESCSPFDQDCAPGLKCVWYANDGGNAWNATQCVAVDPAPVADGEVCAYDGIETGIDNCGVGSMCFNVDSETSEGFCHPLCSGTDTEPSCPTDEYSCSVSASGLNLCLPKCDPIEQDCPIEGQNCYGIDDRFICAPEAVAGAEGGPCEFLNSCAAGLACINADFVADCEGSAGCCAPFCELGSTCAAADTECLPWFEEGQAPEGYEHVGVCGVPEAQ